MNHYINTHPEMGRMLWLEQGDIQIGIALDYGIRVRHLSIKGMENLYYQQPADLSDGFGTPDTWKLRGGHRMWLAPESDDSYYADDAPVSYTLLPNGALIVQDVDPLLHVQKTLEITFQDDGTVKLVHHFYNRSDAPIEGASWGVNTLDVGGKVEIPYPGTDGEYAPGRSLALWSSTSLADPRLTLEKDRILAQYRNVEDYFKLGLYSSAGYATTENKGQRLTICFDTPAMDRLPDAGSNFELYMNKSFIEMETLGVVTHIEPGESASHWETWKLEKL